MKLLAFSAALLLAAVGLGAAESRVPADRPSADETYTITSTLQLVRPYDLDDMTDAFQDARVVARDKTSITVEITYYPLYRPKVGANPRWREEYAGMTEYLRPTPMENWDERMRADLLAELRRDGIDPDRLTDREVVEQVSRWAMRRARTTKAFAIWTLHFPHGHPAIFPGLEGAFERERERAGLKTSAMIAQEALGRSMYYDRVRGSCTSSSVYLSTIFRALGIPTRIVFCIPPFDANDPTQAELFYRSIQHHGVRESVREALDGMRGFANHLFNEVYIDRQWVRLNYAKVNQPIVDARYFGLLTHILTTADLSKVPLAETWGMRYFRYRDVEPRLSSVNPYRLLAVKDRFGEKAQVDNPPVAPRPDLTAVTIVALPRPDSPELPAFLRQSWARMPTLPDFLISIREWVQGNHTQMRVFQKRASNDFVLHAPGHPELRVRLMDARWSQGDGSFQAFGARVVPDDRRKIAPGVAYTLASVHKDDTYRWEIAPDLAPVVLTREARSR